MQMDELKQMVLDALADLKAQDIRTLDVRDLSNVTDIMVIATGSSNRHVKSVASNLVAVAKAQGCRPIGMEGDDVGEWVLVDLGDVVVHVMQQSIREFYDLERLWSTPPTGDFSHDDYQ